MEDDVFWLTIQPEGGITFHGSKPSLEELQQAVGGPIEAAPLRHERFTAYCNEEGKLLGLPFNGMATAIVKPMGDFLVGPVVLIGGPDRHGDDTRLAEDVVADNPSMDGQAMTDEQAQRYFDDLVEKISGSRVFLMLMPLPDTLDIKVATELGVAILLDKPIWVLAAEGRPIPAGLSTIATEVIGMTGDPAADAETIRDMIRDMP